MCRESAILRAVILPVLLLCAAAASAADDPLAIICRATTDTMVIDGRLDERAWADAQPVALKIPVSHLPTQSPATGRVCWNAEFLFVAIDAADKDLKGTRTESDTDVFRDDVLEFFFQPAGENAPYHNIEINVLGTVFDAMSSQRAGFDFTGLRHAINLRGTLNQSDDVDQGWTLEMAIPLGEIGGGGFNPTPGSTWNAHFARYDYSIYLPAEKELSSSATLTRVNFHRLEDWQQMLFR